MNNFHQNPTQFNNRQSNINNFATAFNPMPPVQTYGYDPKSMFNNNNFHNQGNLVHNNLGQIILNEEIREYSIMIDSKDRNYQIYPNPFSYEVRFNPQPTKREKNKGHVIIYEDPAPTINDNFINVRYIKLESVILPFYTKVTLTPEVDPEQETIVKKWRVDQTKNLTDNLYTVLSIGEYTDPNYRSTNDVLADSFATIYYDTKISHSHFRGITSNGTKIFPQDQLAKIDKLKISFMDPYGQSLNCSHVDKNIRSNIGCTCIDPNGDEETDCFEHNLFHPLNPIFQHHIHLKVGVVEPRLNKMTFN